MYNVEQCDLKIESLFKQFNLFIIYTNESFSNVNNSENMENLVTLSKVNLSLQAQVWMSSYQTKRMLVYFTVNICSHYFCDLQKERP